MRLRLIVILSFIAAVTAGLLPAAASAVGIQPTLVSTPTPARTSNSVLDDVDCPSDTACVAVGSAQTHGYDRTALVETWNGSSWKISASGLFPEPKPATLAGVSCADVGACVAVGEGTTADATGSHGAETEPIALREVDGHWRTSRPVLRSGDVTVENLERISCPDASVCEAVGVGIAHKHLLTVIERLHAGDWRLTTSRLPGARITIPGDIGCSGPATCLMTEGGIAAHGAGDQTLSGLLRLTGSAWHRVPSALGPDAVASNVTCPAGASCLAFADTSNQSSTLDEVSDTGALTALPDPVAFNGQAVEILGLTCPALGRCFGLGEAGAQAAGTASTAGTMVAETYDGTAFATVFTGLPLTLEQISCRPTFCMFVGSHGRTTASALWRWPAAD